MRSKIEPMRKVACTLRSREALIRNWFRGGAALVGCCRGSEHLTGRLESGLSPESGRTLPSWHEHHGAEGIPERPDGPPVGQHRATVPAGTRPHRTASYVSGTGGRERQPVPGSWRVYLADAAARLPALEDGLVLLLHLAGRRGVGAGPRRPPGR